MGPDRGASLLPLAPLSLWAATGPRPIQKDSVKPVTVANTSEARTKSPTAQRVRDHQGGRAAQFCSLLYFDRCCCTDSQPVERPACTLAETARTLVSIVGCTKQDAQTRNIAAGSGLVALSISVLSLLDVSRAAARGPLKPANITPYWRDTQP